MCQEGMVIPTNRLVGLVKHRFLWLATWLAEGILEAAARDQGARDGRKLVSDSEGVEESVSARSPVERPRGGDPKPTRIQISNLHWPKFPAGLSVSTSSQLAPGSF